MFLSIGATSPRGEGDDFWYTELGMGSASTSGQRVTPSRSLALPAVYSCVRVIAESVMQIPLILYRRLDNGGKERAIDHPLYSILHDAPNGLQTSAEWREIMQHHLLLRGNAYAPVRYKGHRVTSVGEPIHPDLVIPERVHRAGQDDEIKWRVKTSRGDATFGPSEIMHIRGPGVAADGISGLNPIALEREAIGAGLAAQEFTSRFFKNDAQPGGILKHPGNFKDDAQRNKFRKSWQSAQTGANWRKMAILEYGMEYMPTDVKLVDAQFIEQKKYSNMDVARIFRVPPHLIMEMDRATFSNITQQDVEFVKFTMMPWFVRWESRLSMALLDDDEQEEYFFEFLVDSLERGDSESRGKLYKTGIQDGWLTRNEVRSAENRNPLPGLDEPLEPLNMTNPGGANDERTNEARADALKSGAAQALVRKQYQMILAEHGNTLTPDYFLNQKDMVQQFMQCEDNQAWAYCAATASMYERDIETKMPVELWEKRQFNLLMELT